MNGNKVLKDRILWYLQMNASDPYRQFNKCMFNKENAVRKYVISSFLSNPKYRISCLDAFYCTCFIVSLTAE